MDRGERVGGVGVLFPPREQVESGACGGMAAWRHSVATVATGKTTPRYYRLKLPVVLEKPTKPEHAILFGHSNNPKNSIKI